MRVEGRDGGPERQALIACVVSAPVLSRTAGRLGREPFRSKFANLLWEWCEAYYKQYGSAPGRNIQTLAEEYARSSSDREVLDTLERFLSSLSEEYERSTGVDIEYTLDSVQKLVNEVRLDRLKDTLQLKLEMNDTEAALQAQRDFLPLNLRSPPTIDVLFDSEAQREALEEKQKVLVRYPGAAGLFFGDELSEDSFVAFMAPPKGMKSYALLDIAWRAMRQGRQVAYFQVGDLSKSQIMRRFMRRACRRPLKAKTIRYPTGIVLPISDSPRSLAVVDSREKTYTQDLTWDAAGKTLLQAQNEAKGSIRLSRHPTKSVNVHDIRDALGSWDREGWKPKVVILDYAGNLAAVDAKANAVEQVSYSWAILRQISETRNCLLVTAQQTNKEGFKAWILTRNNFADSKMILAHVTAFLGVNATEEERSNQIVRYNFVERREEQFLESYCLYGGGCLDVANPLVVTTLPGERR